VLEPGMLRADAGIVEAGRHGVGLGDLSVRVLEQISAVAVQDTGTPGAQRCRVPAARESLARGFDADQPDARLADVRMEDSHGVRATADAGDHRVGLAARHLLHLLDAFLANHRLEVTHHHRVGMRPGDRADDVEGALDVRHPVAHGFVERVLQGLRAGLDRPALGAEYAHAVHVRRLAAHVLHAHVDDAFHAVARGDRGGGDAMHAGARFGDDTALPHAAREERLADGVVDLVRAGVVQVFALDVDLGTATLRREAPGVIDRARAADVVL